MSRSKSKKSPEKPGPSGFIVIDKPLNWTSHDVVDEVRRWFGTRRVGHLGTLDPLATGVLPLAVRDATKLIPYVPLGRKVYVGTIRLGIATDTFDAEGRELRRHDGEFPDENAVCDELSKFEGEILQRPPMYSSVKHAGEPLYRIARRGQEVERSPRKVHIYRASMTSYLPPEIGIEVECSPGTYVRSLADDLGGQLGCGAHLSSLRRLESGPFLAEMALSPDELVDDAKGPGINRRLIDAQAVLGVRTVEFSPQDIRRVAHGADVACPPVGVKPALPGERVIIVDQSGVTVALMEVRPDRRLYPIRVLQAAQRF